MCIRDRQCVKPVRDFHNKETVTAFCSSSNTASVSVCARARACARVREASFTRQNIIICSGMMPVDGGRAAVKSNNSL